MTIVHRRSARDFVGYEGCGRYVTKMIEFDASVCSIVFVIMEAFAFT
jgi:hypothetical protein